MSMAVVSSAAQHSNCQCYVTPLFNARSSLPTVLTQLDLLIKTEVSSKTLNEQHISQTQSKSNEVHLLHSILRPHNTPPKELTHNTKPVPGAGQLALEKIMLISGFDLSLPDST
jgi:hypothetical protein